jgi:hypothetical protein
VEKEMKKAYFSKRLYKADMGIPTVNELSYVIELFNRAKRFAFQTLVQEMRWKRKLYKESLHIVVKNKYGLNDYFANCCSRSKSSFLLSFGIEKNSRSTDRRKNKRCEEKTENSRKGHFGHLVMATPLQRGFL